MCRKSLGEMTGNSGVVVCPVAATSLARCSTLAARSDSTAGANTRARQFELLSTDPRESVNTRASRPLPTMKAASSSAKTAGNGTDRRSCVLGVLHTRPPDSVTDRLTFTRRRSMSKSCTRSAAISPHRRPVYARKRTTVASRSTASASAATWA